MRRRGLPIRGQIIALIATTQILSTGLALAFVQFVIWDGVSPPRAVAREVTAPFTTAITALKSLPPAAERTAVNAILTRDPRFREAAAVTLVPEADLLPPGRFYLAAIREFLVLANNQPIGVVDNQTYKTFPLSMANYGVTTTLSDGTFLIFTPSLSAPARLFPIFVFVLLLTLLALPIMAFTIWASGTLVAPLKRLSEAADRFSRDLSAGTAPERGPAEVRTVARAFNAMRARLKSLIDAKSATLAAISHDLRTPLTRMRLRLEGPTPDRTALLTDVRAMEVMVASALSFIRDGTTTLARQPVDVSALAQAVCDDLTDVGAAITFTGPPRVAATLDPALIRRALTNIIQNAVTYGAHATLTLTATDDTVSLSVADNGPGLSEDERFAALEPFWRGDAARTRGADTGFGLGLSITRQIVARHGGTIALADNQPTGLIVTLTLPRAPQNADPASPPSA
ncbi:MAG: HAMP domain-containing sensor histidine kinase [Pseudomonadota bacterium]